MDAFADCHISRGRHLGIIEYDPDLHRMLTQWTFSVSCLVVPVYSMVGGENIMYEFGVVSFLVEAWVDSLSLSC